MGPSQAAAASVTDTPGLEPLRSPLVPVGAVAVGIATLLIAGVGARGAIDAALAGTLVVLAGYDLEKRRLPDRIVLGAAGAILLLQLAAFPEQALEWVIAGLGTAAFLALPRLLSRDGIGSGDVKAGLLLGVALGTRVGPALVIGFVALFPFAVAALAREGLAARSSTLPLVPFLAFGSTVVLLAGI